MSEVEAADSTRTEDPEARQAQAQISVSLDIFQSIRQARAQHGLRHSDFKRYRCSVAWYMSTDRTAFLAQHGLTCHLSGCRQYCTRKLQRTRKALKLTHGRGKFQAKKLEVETVTDSK